jgi:glycosyltransferase involved in cell wall biosynthesis
MSTLSGEARLQATTSAVETRPRICVVGPLLGRNPGYITTIGDQYVEMFRAAGYPTAATSHLTNRYLRLLDIASTVRRIRSRIDILSIVVYGGPSFVVEDVASRIGRAPGLPILMSLHGGAMPEFMARFPRWTRRVLDRAHALVVPSPYLARALEAHGFHAEVIPNIIDLEAYPFRRRTAVRPRLLWMRAFHSIYNPEMAVRVLARVRELSPEATLVMGGQDMGLRPAVERLAAELGVSDAVRFAGFLDMEGKRREFARADIFINTNRIDNQPVSVIEACAMGLPVVSTSVGGIPFLLTHGETGLLVDNEDVDAMARAVVRLTEDEGLAGRLSSNGRSLAARSDTSAVLVRWESVFERLLGNRFPTAGNGAR